MDCYLDPIEVDGTLTCNAGQMFCVDGTWSECRSLRSFEIESEASLSDGPLECNPCNPDCSRSTDYPSADDLTPERADGVVAVPGGISLEGETMTELLDTDGDGIPDDADSCRTTPGTPEYFGCPSGTESGFYHSLPFGGPVEVDPLSFPITVTTADVYFLMDTTGSMGGEISNLQRGLTSGTYVAGCGGGVIGGIGCIVPNAWFGAAFFDDYPVSPYGSSGSGDEVYRNRQDLTSDAAAAQRAVTGLRRHYGRDGPESNSQAIWAVTTGRGLGRYLTNRSSCPDGRWGWPCFRADTIPIIVQFTDATYHQGPSGQNYNPRILAGGGSAGSGPYVDPSPFRYVYGNHDQSRAVYAGDATRDWNGFSGNTCLHNNAYNNIYCNGLYSPDVVFRFTATSTRNILVSTKDSTYNTVAGIRDYRFRYRSCNDNDTRAGSLNSYMDYRVSAGTWYVIVDGYGWRSRRRVCTTYYWWGRPRTSCRYTYVYNSSCGNYKVAIGTPPPPETDTGSGPLPVTWPEVVRAVRERGIKMITVESSGGWGGARPDSVALANATGSTDARGAPFVFSISSSGSGLDRAVIDAVSILANNSRYDVAARGSDNPATEIDERNFVERVTAVSFPAGRCTGKTASTFLQCLPGTSVRFDVAFRNDFVRPTTTAQVFNFFIEVTLSGIVQTRVPVRIVVPPDVTTYEPGSFSRVYDANTRCEIPPERPDWGTFTYRSNTPDDSKIRFVFQTANTEAGLAGADPLTIAVPLADDDGSFDLGQFLVDNGQQNYRPYVKMTAFLDPSSSRTAAPTLTGFEQTFVCADAE